MYIEDIIYNPFLKDEAIGAVTNNNAEYFVDLYSRYNMPIDIDLSKSINSADFLADKLVGMINTKVDIHQVDYIFFPIFGYAWHNDYAVPELYWQHKYHWNAALVDVRDCGNLCIYTAICLILTLGATACLKSAITFSVEQAWIGNQAKKNNHPPEIDYVGSIYLTVNSKKQRLKIICCELIKNISVTFNYCHNLLKIKQIIKQCSIDESTCLFYIKHNDYLKLLISSKNLFTVNLLASSGYVYYCLDHVSHAQSFRSFQHAVIIDRDNSSSTTAILIVKI